MGLTEIDVAPSVVISSTVYYTRDSQSVLYVPLGVRELPLGVQNRKDLMVV